MTFGPTVDHSTIPPAHLHATISLSYGPTTHHPTIPPRSHQRKILVPAFQGWQRYFLWRRGMQEAFKLEYTAIKSQFDLKVLGATTPQQLLVTPPPHHPATPLSQHRTTSLLHPSTTSWHTPSPTHTTTLSVSTPRRGRPTIVRPTSWQQCRSPRPLMSRAAPQVDRGRVGRRVITQGKPKPKPEPEPCPCPYPNPKVNPDPNLNPTLDPPTTPPQVACLQAEPPLASRTTAGEMPPLRRLLRRRAEPRFSLQLSHRRLQGRSRNFRIPLK